MNALTDYRKPAADYLREAMCSRWRALGGWHREGHEWKRVYSMGRRARKARRAVIYHSCGWWQWRVEEFDLGSRAVRRIANRNRAGTGYFSAAAAMPWADAAARTSD